MNRLLMATASLLLALTSHPAAQSAAEPRFEVASVKPSDPNPLGPGGLPVLPTTRIVPGRVVMTNTTLSLLVKTAYDFYFDFRIAGGPDWFTSRRFDIQATAGDAAADIAAMRPMLRTLLADRFKLKVHMETREMPIYALVVARGDGRLPANVKPSPLDCTDPAQPKPAEVAAALERSGRGAVGVACAIWPMPARVAGAATQRANGVSMAALATSLTAQAGRMVLDRTGLSGFYDWEMTYDRRASVNPSLSPSASDSPVLTTALDEQLGLKLESARGPVEVLVIDSAALPEPD